LSAEDLLHSTHKFVILDPEKFQLEKLEPEIIQEVSKLTQKDSEKLSDLIQDLQIKIDYKDLKFDDIMKAIIPDDIINENVNVKGYSIIGHIAHFNLRDQVLDYKNIIVLELFCSLDLFIRNSLVFKLGYHKPLRDRAVGISDH
ncbi:tRNA (guanine(37)-N1)-methyltransferase, partial [Brachionus plicatilis]